ncbi:nucleotidyl transferase AbiEii/AbiGii toxin family protein [Nocardia sp. R16R-3T]
MAAVSRGFGDRLHFIGGTALARTHLVSGRLSEDIDPVSDRSMRRLAGSAPASNLVGWSRRRCVAVADVDGVVT